MQTLSRTISYAVSLIAILTFSVLCAPATRAETVHEENGFLARELQLPIHEWHDDSVPVRGMVLAIHGMAFHGSFYDTYARRLSQLGLIVVAPDLRGHGRWYQENTYRQVSYSESQEDLVAVATALKKRYPQLPLFCTGESLGGAMAIRISAQHPDLFDGLILSAPAIKHYHPLSAHFAAEGACLILNPKRKMDIRIYLAKYISDNEHICQESLNDPLSRKNMSAGELLCSCKFMADSADFVESVPFDLPVLVLQGTADRLVKAEAVHTLEDKLRTSNKTFHWLEGRGHILLETSHIPDETMNFISNWISKNSTVRRDHGTVAAQPARHVIPASGS